MPRLFVAFPLPDEVKDRLLAIQPPAVPGMRLLEREDLHLTLHFLGEVAAKDVDAVRAALATVKMSRFTVALRGTGHFAHDGRPQVLWAAVDDSAELTALHRAIGFALTEAIGFQPEQRPYSPHVTLARINAPVPPYMIHRHLEENGGFAIPSVLFDRFVLYSSSFADGVPRYQEEAVFPLLGSSRSRPEVAWIGQIGRGLAGIMPRPRGGDWLEDEIRSLATSGVNVLVSLLTADEAAELALHDEERLCGACGIRFVSLPIPDRGVPISTAEAKSTVDLILTELRAGKTVAIHCRMGIGRSALIAACLLKSQGVTVDAAFATISRARGYSVPDTEGQRQWVRGFR